MIQAFLQWLAHTPIDDPIERRNAAGMQAILIFLGVTVPLNWWLHHSMGMVAPATRALMAVDIAAALAGFGLIALIRRGRFRPAVWLFVAITLLSMLPAYLHFGLLRDQTSQMLVLVVSGLFLGRRALWTVMALLLCTAATGAGGELLAPTTTARTRAQTLSLLLSFAMSYLVVTVVIDLCITALRRSLAESDLRGRRLQREMAERERAQAQLIQSQKLEATGRLASGVAHDFDTVLSLMTGFASERHRLDDPDYSSAEHAQALADALEGVEAAAMRGKALSRRLLAFAQPQTSMPRRFDVGEAIGELLPMLRQMFDPRVRIAFDPPAQPLAVWLDRHQFDLLLFNIAANARDAMHAGGTFVLRVGPDRDARRVRIELSDTGVGMAESVRAQAFEPFFTTKPSGRGTGLGLAVAHSLVSGAGGSIELDSRPGAGTTVRICLPLHAAEETGAAPAQANDVST